MQPDSTEKNSHGAPVSAENERESREAKPEPKTEGENPAEKQPVPKSAHCEREERILQLWQEQKIFERSLEKPAGAEPKGNYTFYDGPPFATGSPHYGHILAGTIKDVIPRWKTMQGFRVRRRWGWDCHGLPVENLVEKELGLKSKKDIVAYGIEKFNAQARQSVMRYEREWREIIPRLGRWVDMEHDYKTMDTGYTETVWWIFKQLHDKGLIYEGFKSMNICPRCETTLSNFEVAQGYKDITDISAYVKFEIPSFVKSGSERGVQSFKIEEGTKTFFLAWTTTPWTLPGNVALAVNPALEYVKIKDGQTYYILAKERYLKFRDGWLVRKLLTDPKEIETMKGAKLVGISYAPLFDYYSRDQRQKNRGNGWKVYGADFVTTEDGTGIVHIAPAFGADDYELLKEYDLPFIQHVTTDGHFKGEVRDFGGRAVKPIDTAEDKNAHQSADIEIIKWLAHQGMLFDKEKIVHSYPHCWRCDTPLLNYAASSWFVEVTALKEKLLKENKKVGWVPPEVGEGRFGNWLEGARDWAISRSRFWGAPIPVWKQEERRKEEGGRVAEPGAGSRELGTSTPGISPLAETTESHSAEKGYHVIGSIDELKKLSHARNAYHIMRHGMAVNNAQGILSGDVAGMHHLTLLGWEQVLATAKMIREKKLAFDMIFVSPFLRTQETAEILTEKLGWKHVEMHADERLRELGSGLWNGRKLEEFQRHVATLDRFESMVDGIESWTEIKKRMGDFIYDLEKKYHGKSILIITHETPAFLLEAAIRGLDRAGTNEFKAAYDFMDNAELRKLDFTPLPHNDDFEIDLHRPYIDALEMVTADGHRLTRVPDVFDCWFESGSMPYGEAHYPFKKREAGSGEQGERSKEKGAGLESGAGSRADVFQPESSLLKKSKGFPADFIAEGVDQTRGWFYSMMVLGVGLFGVSPYKKVIVNGLVLAEDGQKMSKRQKNYPDPMDIVSRYGADALRFYLLSSPVVRGQDLCFSERGVDEVTKKIVNRLLNVLSFYEMYAQNSRLQVKNEQIEPQNVLDRWIISRLNETIGAVSAGLEAGELDRAARPFLDFGDDLSTWYLRRSRDRFKGDDLTDKEAALETTKFVLQETAKLLAPFMPFLAEEIYGKSTASEVRDRKAAATKQNQKSVESVHLQAWPKAGPVDPKILAKMVIVRSLSSKGLEARTKAKINVRQPLPLLKTRDSGLDPMNDDGPLIALIKDEVNVKDIRFGQNIEPEVELDTAISPELQEEGEIRELIRKIQDLRKEKGLTVNDEVVLTATEDMKGLILKNQPAIKAATHLSAIEFGAAFDIKC